MQPTTETQSSAPLDPVRWVAEHGDVLFRYALARVRNEPVAEDLVQETFLAAWKARKTFEGRSEERSWLIGILKHKIVDYIRRVSREREHFSAEALPSALAEQFDKSGHWNIGKGLGPQKWAEDAASVCQRREFWKILNDCLGQLPSRTAEAFILREVDGENGDEVCKVLNISPTNYWVLLHRARMQLRRCLEMNWFGKR